MNYFILPAILSGSVWQIVQDTSVFGKVVLLVLLAMSIVSWVIIFSKWRQFRAVEKATTAFLTAFRRARKMDEAIGQAKSQAISPLAQIFVAGYDELTQLNAIRNEGGALQSQKNPLQAEDFEILEMTLERSSTEAIGQLERLVFFLATTGNSAPFMGLLGTVVGIMDSFWSIGEMGSASLAVVAPGIAEALLATIVGLGAAIPAVIAYNWANSKTKFANDGAAAFTLEFLARARKENR
jgi:biopolymer transport protein TolQ